MAGEDEFPGSDRRWICMGTDTMDDGSCDCEVWIDTFTHRGYGVAEIQGNGERHIFVVTLLKNKLEPVMTAEGVPDFATHEEARQFLFAHVQQ